MIDETCEDRNYDCCELMPPRESPCSPTEYNEWYDAHVNAYHAAILVIGPIVIKEG